MEQLARMVKSGFSRAAAKADVEDFVQLVKRGFDETATKQEMRMGFQTVADALDLIRQDVHDIKVTLGPLVRTVAHMEGLLREHDKRIERLERKVGLTR